MKSETRVLTYTCRGKKQTVKEWSEELGISKSTVRLAMSKNADLYDYAAETIRKKNYNYKKILEYNGVKMNLKEWAECLHINLKTLQNAMWRYDYDLKKYIDYRASIIPRRETLCWNCNNDGRTCEWMDKGIPVPGWEADETRLKDCYGKKTIKSYCVHKCPKFVKYMRVKK